MVNAPWSAMDVSLSSPATAADAAYPASSQGLLGDQLVEIIMRRQQPEASATAAASSSGNGSTSPFRRERERLRNIREEAIRLAFDREREAQRVMIDAQRDTIRAGDQVIEALREQVRQMQQRLDHTISMNRTLLEQRRDLLASAVQVVTYPSSDNSTATPQHTTMFSRTVAEEAASLSSLVHMTEQPTAPQPTEVQRIRADIIPHWTEEGRVSWTSAPEEVEIADSESIYDDMPPLVMLDGTPAPDTPPARARELGEEPLLSDPFWQDAPTPRSLSPAPHYRSRAREFQVRVQRYLATGRARRVLEASDNTTSGEGHTGEEDIQSMTQWLSLPPRRDPLDPPTDTLQSFRDSLARLPLQPWSTSYSYPLADTSKTEDEAAAEAVAAAARIAASKPAMGGAYNDQMAQYELKYGLVDRDGDKIPLHAASRLTQPRLGFGCDVIGR